MNEMIKICFNIFFNVVLEVVEEYFNIYFKGNLIDCCCCFE